MASRVIKIKLPNVETAECTIELISETAGEKDAADKYASEKMLAVIERGLE